MSGSNGDGYCHIVGGVNDWSYRWLGIKPVADCGAKLTNVDTTPGVGNTLPMCPDCLAAQDR